MDADPNKKPPVIDYATPQTSRLKPDIRERVDAMIEAGASPRDIRWHFHSTREAVEYYAKAMERKYSQESLGCQCVVCGGNVGEKAVRLRWRVQMEIGSFEFSLKSTTKADFSSFHSICDTCLPKWRWQLANHRLRWRIIPIVTVIIFLGFFGFIVQHFREAAASPLWSVIFLPILYLCGVVGRFAGNWLVERFRPLSLKRLMNREVRLMEWGGIHDRNDWGLPVAKSRA